MPQLDILSFSTQVSWVIVLFFINYFVVTNVMLKKIYRTLKVRKDILQVYEKEIYIYIKELIILKEWLNIFFKNFELKNFILLNNILKDVQVEKLRVKERQDLLFKIKMI